MLTAPQLETLLAQRTRFRRLLHVTSCTSTQDLAAAEPRDGDAVFWADHQTKGRGRQQREWHDEPGADLAVTFRLRLALPQPLALPAALPLAVLQACEPLLGRPLRVKWPNDLFLDGRKLCGVLIDAGFAGPDSYLIGVGVNCNRVRFPPDLETIATSLAAASGHLVDRGALLLAIAERLHTMLDQLVARRHGELEALFRDRLGLFGRRVVVDVGGAQVGVLTGLDFQQLTLDGGRSWPLAIVRSIRAE
ncbi:MAG: biotin--[acetyl-CoA-carboxylase] ligase [Planctomycetes bacterium]|jgi:BirA family biotin operon repressor/biotin-[acetyl-CoA-carboxylase] ligase|nr:biotin--[acetyl-CoA-carboxylase] ligase [Planctomycetota bacterium]